MYSPYSAHYSSFQLRRFRQRSYRGVVATVILVGFQAIFEHLWFKFMQNVKKSSWNLHVLSSQWSKAEIRDPRQTARGHVTFEVFDSRFERREVGFYVSHLPQVLLP